MKLSNHFFILPLLFAIIGTPLAFADVELNHVDIFCPSQTLLDFTTIFPLLEICPIDTVGEIDTDGDGLLDDWEINGIDIDGDGTIDLDLPALGADPLRKDIFIEVDYMVFHQPNSIAISNVVAAFANSPVDAGAGINLHIDIDEQITHADETTIWSGFDSIKSTNFGTLSQRTDTNAVNILAAKRDVYHYALFIHQQPGSSSSGVAEIHGNDFIVSLGAAGWGTDLSGHNVGSIDEQEGTFMHELGHNLNLQHGGGDVINCKPNYLSVMSYSFQMSSIVPGRSLDYSSENITALDENNLDETIGVPSTSGLDTIYGPPLSRTSQTGVGIDWDRDGTTSGITSANINRLTDKDPGCTGAGTILNGFDDWNSLLYDFKTSPHFADGAHPDPSEHQEITPEIIDQMIANKEDSYDFSFTINNPLPDADDHFGSSVAGVGNDKLLVGAPDDDAVKTNSGSAYLFNATNGQLLLTLNNPTPKKDDHFGDSVAGVGDDKVLVGAPLDDTGAHNTGSVYLFNATTGQLLLTINNPFPSGGDSFGGSVAGVGNDKLLVGATEEDTGARNTGSAYLFDATTGQLLLTINNPTPEKFDRFGTSVAGVGNDKLLIGAAGDDTGATNAGSVYLFDATTGQLLLTINNPFPNGFDQFGDSVGVVGNIKLLVGAFSDNTGASNAGSAYLFG